MTGTNPAVVLCGHGTRHHDGAAEFHRVAALVQAALPQLEVLPAFLELAEPLLPAVLDTLAVRGCRDIAVVPIMLFAAGHAKIDIPEMMCAFAGRFPDVKLRYGRTLGIDPELLGAAAGRAAEALGPSEAAPGYGDTVLLMVGRGSSDPDANSDLAKLMRLLWEGLGFGCATLGYFDVTRPNLEQAFDHAARLGYRRVLALPWLLFSGVLGRRLNEAVAAAQARHPGLEIIAAPTLNDHPGVIAAIAARAAEAAGGP